MVRIRGGCARAAKSKKNKTNSMQKHGNQAKTTTTEVDGGATPRDQNAQDPGGAARAAETKEQLNKTKPKQGKQTKTTPTGGVAGIPARPSTGGGTG